MSDLDRKGVEMAARQLAIHRGRNPEECINGSGSLNHRGESTFECHQRAWEAEVPKAAAAIHAYLEALAKEAGK